MTTKTNGPDTSEHAAAYVGWGTFKNFILEGMKDGPPNVIDKSIMSGMAGGLQGHLLSSLKFLGLIDDRGVPLEPLLKLTTGNEADQKETLAAIIHQRYAALIAIGLERASMKQLLDTLETAFRVSGETKEKAARFFISAAQFAGISLSRHILEGGISSGRRRAAKRPATAPIAEVERSREAKPPVPTSPTTPLVGESRTVTLASGGTLTLSASVGFMKLAKADRDFVFGLIDQLDQYEADNPSAADEQAT